MIIFEDLKIIDYGEAWHYQQQLFDDALLAKHENRVPQNYILFCEHPHVITMGKNSHQENVLFTQDYLKSKGVSLFQIDRGGDVTYHGYGQLVAYPILDLEAFGIGLRQYIYNLEEVVIRLLKSYNIHAQRLDHAPGVWIKDEKTGEERKICAIGVRSSRFVTMHGFALNVNTDLAYFSLINPCGFVDKGVTSMKKELGMELNLEELKAKSEAIFREVFIL